MKKLISMALAAGMAVSLAACGGAASSSAPAADSAAASTTANNVGALTDLYGSFLGKPIIKIASTFYALKTTGQSFLAKNAAKTTVNDTAEKGE